MYNVIYPRGKNNRGVTDVTTSKTWHKNDDASSDVVAVHPAGAAYIIVESSVERWGRKAAIKSESTKTDRPSILNWGAAELLKNCEPQITISIDALELSQITGVSIDKLSVGRRCRIPLPQYGTTFEDRIIQTDWPDLVKDPYSMKITLSTERRTVESVWKKTVRKIRKKQEQLGCDLAELGK